MKTKDFQVPGRNSSIFRIITFHAVKTVFRIFYPIERRINVLTGIELPVYKAVYRTMLYQNQKALDAEHGTQLAKNCPRPFFYGKPKDSKKIYTIDSHGNVMPYIEEDEQ